MKEAIGDASHIGFLNLNCHSWTSERHWSMAIYVYETIPQAVGEVPVQFEVKQGMNDPKLMVQPGSGKPVRRLVSGGFLLQRRKQPSVGSVTDPSFHQKD